MKSPDIDLTPPQFIGDANATRELASMVSKLVDILRDIYDKLQTIEVVGTAPVSTEIDEKGDGKGNIVSDIKILDNATQTNRRIYYKYQGNLRYIESD